MRHIDYSFHFGFIEAIKCNSFDEILRALDNEDFEKRNPFHWTPLHYTVAFSNYDCTCEILKKSKDCLDTKDKYQRTALSLAAANGNSQLCSLLLKSGANVNIGLPVCYAVTNGNIECVQVLLNGGCNVNEEDYHTFRSRHTPLVIAAQHNNAELIKLLVDHNADTNFGVGKHEMPLHWACRFGCLETVKALVTKKTDLNSRCEYENTALDYAIINDKLDVVKYLLSKGSSVNVVDKFGSTPFHTACKGNIIDDVKEMLKYNPDVNVQDSDGYTPLLTCSYSEQINEDIFECLVNSGADVNVSAFNNWTPLHFCCFVGNLKCVKMLLEKLNEDGVNAATMEGVTPLYLAAAEGHTDICKNLLEKGACVNVKVNGFRNLCWNYPGFVLHDVIRVGYDPKKIALERNHSNIVELLHSYEQKHSTSDLLKIGKDNELEPGGEATSNKNSDVLGWTTLYYGCESHNLLIIKKYIEAMDNVDVMDKYLRTPLTIASGCGNTGAIELLVKGGADPNLGFTLFYAIENNQPESVEYLLHAGADINMRDNKMRTPLMYSILKHNLIITKHLLKCSADVSLTDEERNTALHHSCSYSFVDAAKLLIENGADINAQNSFNETPLHLAAVAGDETISKLLLENGANIEIKDKFLETPLHYLSSFGPIKCMEEILKYSPDLNTRNKENFVPIISSLHHSNLPAAKLLLEHGASLNETLFGGWTPVHSAAYEGFTEILTNSNVDVNVLNSEGISPLHVAAKRGHLNFVKKLVERGCIIDTPAVGLQDWRSKCFSYRYVFAQKGETPLMAAICSGNLEIVEYLYRHGASLKSATEQGYTALYFSVLNMHFDIFKFLIEQGCTVEQSEKDKLLQTTDNKEFRVQIETYLSNLTI